MISAEGAMTSSYRRLAVTVLLVNIVSALLFIAVVRGFVYDDSRNVRDVRRYATNGVTVETIRAHLNPTGPTSFIWMAAGARLFSGDEIGGARLAIVMSWVLLGAGVLFAGRRSDFPELWYASLLITLIYPHTMIATATMMTEGPALLLAVLGALAWLSSISAPHVDARGAGLMAIGGLALGLAITSRQYYIALVPAAAAVAALQIWKRPDPERGARIATAAASLVLATIPIVLLTIIWKGLSSPAIASGVAYARWKSSVGINLARPVTAAFDIAAWLTPVTFPVMSRLQSSKRWLALFGSLATGGLAAHFRETLVQPGPLRSLETAASRVPHGGFLVIAVIGAAACYNAIALGGLLRERHSQLARRPEVVFSLLVILFFVLEQLGIGGNIPFYDRYVLQLAPFLGIVSFFALPKLTIPRLAVFAVLLLFSHALLWRLAFHG